MQNQTIPQQRIMDKVDSYMARRDYAGVERHLLYWLAEAQALGDKRGELMVRNELVGHYRKTAARESALEHVEAALALVDELELGQAISAGTTYVNAATALAAFGMAERAAGIFAKAQAIYEASPHTPPAFLGGLYNNRALACVALGRFEEADGLFKRALDTMAQVQNGQLEQAITYLNMADAAVARLGEEEAEREVQRLLDAASDLLDTPQVPRDGYYAFVCEKCAPTFARFGYFLVDADLRERARAIYERA